jgi:NADH dehydrogenase [ubiquinone] 1 alpha subcomplex assembly factor 3
MMPRPSRNLTTSARVLAAAPRPQSQSAPPPARPDPPRINPRAPKTHDRGPVSEEDTQTDFSKMDILANAGAVTPANSIDACTPDGFHLNNGQQTTGGLGLLLLDGEAFVWTPWDNRAGKSAEGFGKLLDKRGILNLPPSSLGVLELVYPKPDLLLIGTGRKLWMLGKETRKYLSETLGIRVDVMDTGNAAAAYNLLATERGITQVAALMIPDGFRGL